MGTYTQSKMLLGSVGGVKEIPIEGGGLSPEQALGFSLDNHDTLYSSYSQIPSAHRVQTAYVRGNRSSQGALSNRSV